MKNDSVSQFYKVIDVDYNFIILLIFYYYQGLIYQIDTSNQLLFSFYVLLRIKMQ